MARKRYTHHIASILSKREDKRQSIIYKSWEDSDSMDIEAEYNPLSITNTPNTQTHKLIIGEAGVGKSYHINHEYVGPNYLKLSPTGVSACSIKATTIHSYFGLGADASVDVPTAYMHITKEKRRKLQRIHTLIIDEVYTCSEKVMNKVDELLRLICNINRPFANKRLVMTGDYCQLESVDNCFVGSRLFKRLNVKRDDLPWHEHGRLDKDYRDALLPIRSECDVREFIELAIANGIGEHKFSDTEFEINNTHGLTVAYRNKDVDAINAEKINVFEGDDIIVGDSTYKKGMPIMLTRNITGKIKQGLYNGKVGALSNYINGVLSICHDCGTSHPIVEPTDFKPCFAMTIHKVQGLTLPNINIVLRMEDLELPSIRKLVYVALTRVSNASKCYLKIMPPSADNIIL